MTLHNVDQFTPPRYCEAADNDWLVCCQSQLMVVWLISLVCGLSCEQMSSTASTSSTSSTSTSPDTCNIVRSSWLSYMFCLIKTSKWAFSWAKYIYNFLQANIHDKAGRNFRLKSEIFSVLLSGPVPLLLTACLWGYSSRMSEFNMSIMNKIKFCLAILYLFTIVPSLFVDLLESLLRYYFLLLL